jgi:hypothetical protein
MPFPQPIDDGGADHLKVGMVLTPIPLWTTTGSEVCLATHPGRSVIAIYPWTGRPGHPNPPDWDVIPGAHGSTPELDGFSSMNSQDAAWRFSA